MQRSYCLSIVFVIALFGSISGVYAQDSGDKAIAYAYERVKSPGELSQLPQFTSLEEAMREPEKVYKLSLAEDDMKNFPMEVLMFKNLQVLNLADNKIKEIPPEIGTLKNLTELNLRGNKISELPPEIGDLSNLNTLYLAKNKLHKFPVQMRGLNKLRYIDLSFNNMLPYEIKWLQRTCPEATIRY